MIAKGNPHNSGPYLARYLAASSKGNESAELEELRGFAADSIFDAFALGQLQAEGTHCQNPFFHVQVRTPKGEELTRQQWGYVADRIERQLGFDGQPRAVVFHQKDGHKHMHLVWSRIDVEDMHAIDPGLYKRKLKEICRKLERELGLQQVRNERGPKEKAQAPARPEFEQARRLKTDVKGIREAIRSCWDKSKDGAGFLGALEVEGLILARGDKRSFVVVDVQGGYHALGKRITGATAQETRVRLAKIEATSLPTVEEAKSIQRERLNHKGGAMVGQEQDLEAEAQRVEAARIEEERRVEAIQEEETRRQQAISEEEERRQKAIAEDEERRQAGIREEEKRQEAFKEQADRQVEQAREMEEQEQRLEAFKAQLIRRAEVARLEEERRSRDADRRAQEGEIREAGNRYGQALGRHYDIRDPYGSLARAAMEEYRTFLQDRESLDRQIARADDPKTREALEIRKRIEAAEYMAITSNRIANQSEIIVGRRDTDEAKHQRARAAAFQKEASELRNQFREIQGGREAGRDTQVTPLAPRAEALKEPEQQQALTRGQQSVLMVQERRPGRPRGEPQKLTEFVKELPEDSNQGKRAISPDEIRRDPAAKRAHYAKLMAEKERGPALDRMREDMKAGRPLSADDVRKLNTTDRENIRKKGDDHLRQLIQQRERERAHERER